jgi:predicted NodU family carbamoyl transferase
MVVLGVSAIPAHSAAAVAADGHLLSAIVEEALSTSPQRARVEGDGELPSLAIRSSLSGASLTMAEVSVLAVADADRWADDTVRETNSNTERNQKIVHVAASHAAAALAAATLPRDGAARVVIIDGLKTNAGAIFRSHGGRLKIQQSIRGAGRILEAARTIAKALGLEPDASALDALAELGAPDAADDTQPLRQALRLDSGEIRFDAAALTSHVEQVQNRVPGPLARANHPHLDVQRARRALASAFVSNLLDLLAELVSSVGVRVPGPEASSQDAAAQAPSSRAASSQAAYSEAAEPIAFGGSLFASPRFNSRLATRLGGLVTFSPVPEPVGFALGAALAVAVSPAIDAAATNGGPLTHLALGPSFTEDEIKATLENCRIDFVYEPNWQRLLRRTSRLLSRGKVVAWFQGPLDFGSRSLGSRGILCDPSNRYARHNVNEYLLGRPVDAPLAVSLLADAADDFLDDGLRSPFMLRRGQFREPSTEQFRSALDSGRGCTVHTATQVQSAELRELLTAHRQETGVPGLIHHPLASGSGPMAATPRAALQAFYSSAIDAMVIGRFLLMKDYWLLRSDA